MRTLTSDPKTLFKSLQTLYMAMLIAMALIFLIIYYLKGELSASVWDIKNVNLIVGLVMALMAILLSPFLYVSRIKMADASTADLEEKVLVYRFANIARFAVIEGGCLVNLILFYITNNSAHLYLAIACLITFVMNRPSATKFARDLQLSENELGQIQGP